MKEHIVFGILAHVDAGKTTLSEGLLFASGKIKEAGRVDKKNTYLDNYELERERGITIFSKQAEFEAHGKKFTLLDTPGHIDFYAEMERSLSVLDYAVLVISATEGVCSQTMARWELLKKYKIPTFLFVNKMDMKEEGEEEILLSLKEKLGESVVRLPKILKREKENEEVLEEIAVLDEGLLEGFLEGEEIEREDIQALVEDGKLKPCYFGSALKQFGVEEFLEDFSKYVRGREKKEEFAARVFKIEREENGLRLVHLRLFGGSLRVKEELKGEKINQIRVYSGGKYEVREEVFAGEVFAVVGITGLSAGEGLGSLSGFDRKVEDMQIMSYRILLPEGVQAISFLPKIRELSEEIPELQVKYQEETGEITVALMGEVHKEVMCYLIQKKYGIEVSFGEGSILYKETLAEEVEGVGHFEPLRHYAEVHLRMSPLPRGAGLHFESEISEDELASNWQKAVLTHLAEKEHKGVLVGASITDMKISLIAGKAHLKHTEGGDFRQAVYRAVRQGLMRGRSILLEPMYAFRLEVPEKAIGRAMADFTTMRAEFKAPELEEGISVLTGRLPASMLKDYQTVLRSYTSGEGRLSLSFGGYEEAERAEEIIEEKQYYPETDLENTADSVFCSHGAGFVVPWNEVGNYMHIPYRLTEEEEGEDEEALFLSYAKERELQTGKAREEGFIGYEEVDSILGQAVNKNKKREEESARNRWKKRKAKVEREQEDTNRRTEKPVHKANPKEDFLLIDGYNIIFAWEELRKLAESNIDSARDRLIEKIGNYQGYKGMNVILVFDAYKVKGGRENVISHGGLDVIYTKEAETADQYIARTSKILTKNGRVSVATSDGMVQMIIFGSGANRISATELEGDVRLVEERIREEIE